MKHLNFIRIGLVAALCMLWSCNSSSNPQDSKEQSDSIKQSSTPKVVSASKGKDIDFSKIRVSSRGIDFLDEERSALTIECGGGLPFTHCSQTSLYPKSSDFTENGMNETYEFFDRSEVEFAQLSEGEPYVLLYNGDELMVALKPDVQNYSCDIYSSKINTIIVYSDKLKMSNGIHTGLSAKEMVETYNAKIRYESGPEVDFLSFDIEGFPSNVKLMGSFDSVDSHLEGDYEYLKLEDVKNGKLDAIVILPQWAADDN